jgi:hypothetical protein
MSSLLVYKLKDKSVILICWIASRIISRITSSFYNKKKKPLHKFHIKCKKSICIWSRKAKTYCANSKNKLKNTKTKCTSLIWTLISLNYKCKTTRTSLFLYNRNYNPNEIKIANIKTFKLYNNSLAITKNKSKGSLISFKESLYKRKI